MKKQLLAGVLSATMVMASVSSTAMAVDVTEEATNLLPESTILSEQEVPENESMEQPAEIESIPASEIQEIAETEKTADGVVKVDSAEELQKAVEDAEGGVETTIRLVDNISEMTTSQIVTIPENKSIILDMNGKEITVDSNFEGRIFVNKGTLTVTGNGRIDSSEAMRTGYGAINNFGRLIIENGYYTNGAYADGATIYNRSNAQLIINGGEINGNRFPAIISIADMTINGGKMYNVSCNQDKVNYAYYAVLSGGTSGANLEVHGGEISGIQGALSVIGGTAVIDGGKFLTKKCEHNNATFYALYVAGEEDSVSCQILDGDFVTEGNHAAVLIGNSADGGRKLPVDTVVRGGTFTAPDDVASLKVDQNLSNCVAEVTGGTFSSDVSKYIDPSSDWQEENGQYVVKPIPESEGVAAIGDKYYKTLDDALGAAKDGDTVKLLADATQDITLDRPITIDGQNQYTITGSTKLLNGTLKNLTLTTTTASLLTIGSTEQNTIHMEGVTVKYPVTGTTAGTISVAGGNNADIVITRCTFMNEPNNNGVTENAPEWSYGIYMNEQGVDGSFTFENSRFDGAFRTMLANINGTVSVTGSTFVNSIFSNNSGSTSGSGEEATCITTANADVSGISITGNTFDNAGAFYFQKTEGADVADNTFKFDRFEHYIQVRGGAAHPLDLSDNTFEMGNNDLVSIDVTAAPVIYPTGQKVVSYWAWAETDEQSRPEDYSSYVYAYNADGSKTFYPESNAALNAFLKPNAGNIGVVAEDTVEINHNLTLTGDTVIPEDATLVINEDVTLTVPEGATLTNNGTVVNPDRINGAVSSGESAVSKSSVTFEVYPEHASIVVVNAQGEMMEPVSDGLYYLEAGSYTYKVSAEGYSDKSQTFVVDKTAQTISVTLKKISSGGASHPEAGSTSSSDRYEITKPSKVENGSIKVSDSKAEKGDTVTITVTPDEGYELDKLAVYDEDGDKIDLKDKGDGKFTFEMPKGDVEIEVSFALIEDETVKANFADVAADAWYADAVQYVYENGMMSGTSETTFSPDLTTTRGMIVTILYRLEGSPNLSNENLGYPYADVDANAYYADAVYWARQNGIVSGMSAEQFAPNNAITREQMAAILYRYAQFKDYDVSAKADLSVYTDAVQVSTYATDAMAWANGAQMITGTSATTLTPAGNATRAQVATILMRFCESIAK